MLHRDDALLAVDKPAGLLAVPGRGADKADCVAARVQAAHPGARIVHRLDRWTSGVMVVARSDRARESLMAQLAAHSVDREYVANLLDNAVNRNAVACYQRDPHLRLDFGDRQEISAAVGMQHDRAARRQAHQAPNC